MTDRATPEQLHEMLTHCIEFARTMLERAGEFYPFGATVDRDGAVGAVGGYDGHEQPNPTDIYQLLSEGFAKGAAAGDYRGVALAANVNIPAQYSPPAPDGLRVHIESRGYSRFIYVPYRMSKRLLSRRNTIEFADPIAVEVPPVFYIDANDA